MDWSKTKNIIIIALLCTNIFLIFIYIEKNQVFQQFEDNQTYIDALEKKNVEIACDVVRESEKMPTLKVLYDSQESEKIQSFIAENEDIQFFQKNGAVGDSEKLRESLQKAGLQSKYMKLVKMAQNQGKIVLTYTNYYEDKPIGGSDIEFTFTEEGKLVGIEGRFIDNISENNTKINVSNPYLAIFEFISRRENGDVLIANNEKTDQPVGNPEDEIIIKNIKQGFIIKRGVFEEKVLSDTVFPAWEITDENYNRIYIESYME